MLEEELDTEVDMLDDELEEDTLKKKNDIITLRQTRERGRTSHGLHLKQQLKQTLMMYC